MLINKVAKKKIDGKCYVCRNDDYSVLDVHRIIPGEQGGKYEEHNCVTLCANCHRKAHNGQIIIDRKYYTSSGKWVMHYWEVTDGNKEEFWL